jgi:hypothetical protein
MRHGSLVPQRLRCCLRADPNDHKQTHVGRRRSTRAMPIVLAARLLTRSLTCVEQAGECCATLNARDCQRTAHARRTHHALPMHACTCQPGATAHTHPRLRLDRWRRHQHLAGWRGPGLLLLREVFLRVRRAAEGAAAVVLVFQRERGRGRHWVLLLLCQAAGYGRVHAAVMLSRAGSAPAKARRARQLKHGRWVGGSWNAVPCGVWLERGRGSSTGLGEAHCEGGCACNENGACVTTAFLFVSAISLVSSLATHTC